MNKVRFLGLILFILGIIISNYLEYNYQQVLAGILCGFGLILTISGKIPFKRNA